MNAPRLPSKSPLCVGLALLLAYASVAGALTTTWNGSGDGTNWFDPGNWDTGLPGSGTEVVINSGAVLLTNSTPELASLTLGGGSLTFSNWTTKLTATNVAINSGTMTLPVAFTDTQMSNRVWIACSNLTVLSGASINVDYRGYARRESTAAAWGYGPGAGYGGSGAGHGGRGGQVSTHAAGGIYGAADQPQTPGSSGGSFKPDKWGGAGGGVVYIDALGAVVVNGTLSANGDNNTLNAGGGGAGGSIYINCHTFHGTNGTVRANGGGVVNPSTGGGGGGRIAVVYDALEQALLARPTVTFSALGGALAGSYGDIGTLSFTDASFLTPNVTHNGWFLSPTLTNWSVSALTLTNVWLRFPNAFSLNVTNDVTVYGANGRLQFTNTTLTCGGDVRVDAGKLHFEGGAQKRLMAIGGNLVLTNGAEFHIRGGMTNAATEDYGARVSVTDDLLLSANSWVYPSAHPTNGGSPLFEARHVTVNADCGFDADLSGFAGRPSSTDDYGRGPGRGYDESGAGYGGAGGDGGHGPAGGVTYGTATAPLHPGSSGGSARPGSTTYTGGDGGGLVRLSASGTLSVYGTITANGEAQTLNSGGGGAGGGIWLKCATFYGDAGGLLSADGGKGGAYYAGGGGGGRIAVWRYLDTSTGQIPTSTTGGAGGTISPVGLPGATGTVVFVDTGPAITNLWATNITATTAKLVGELTSTGVAPVQVTCYWGTIDKLGDKVAWQTNAYLGWREAGAITNPVTELAVGALHYFRFYATNVHGGAWAAPSAAFSTPGGLGVNNDGGATDITDSTVTLRGVVTAGSPVPATYFCWGDDNAGRTDTSLWDHVDYAATLLGAVSTGVGGLTANKTYHYCAFTTNTGGGAWASSVTNFETDPPSMTINDVELTEGDAGTTDLDFTVTLSTSSAIPVSVTFATSNGWAETPADYTSTGGVLTIPAGDLTGVITVPVIGDTVDEHPYQDFYVNLNAPADVTIADAQGRATITDDDDQNQTKTWTGVGNWNSFTNWSPVAPPSPADDVVLASGELTLSNGVTVSSVTVDDGSMVFTNWTTKLSATDVTLNAGTITHVAHSDTNGADGWAIEARVWIACSNLTVGSSATISADEKGYPRRQVEGWGYGPGAGYAQSGAGHGGWGGVLSGTAGGNYGSASEPQTPGSSGGGILSSELKLGGLGGGVIRIEATGAIVVDGVISADGGDNTSNAGGGGAAGSIYITCRTIDGSNGDVRADGGGIDFAGGGGGGRIAVDYDEAAQAIVGVPGVTFSAAPGPNGDLSGGFGTLAFKDNLLLSGAIPHRGVWLASAASGPWALDSLTLSGGHLRFPASGAVLTVANDVLINGKGSGLSLGGNTHWTNSVSEYRLVSTPSSHALHVGGDLVLTNGASLHVYAGVTNGADYGGLVSVTGNMHVANGCWVYPYAHRTNGGPVRFEMTELHVATNGGFDADMKGYSGGEKGVSGYGPGATPSGGSYASGAGAGYGGVGGTSFNARPGGPPCGSTNAPADAGSGGDGSADLQVGGYGGGAVRIAAAGNVTMDGTIKANGEDGQSSYSGAGSGGGIWITCGDFSGAGRLQADGGAFGPTRGGEGGGGRIAVWYSRAPTDWDKVHQGTASGTLLITTNHPAFAGTTSVQPGLSSVALPQDGEEGTTIFLTLIPPRGTLFAIH